MTTLFAFCSSVMFLMAGSGSSMSMRFAILAVTIGIIVDLARLRYERAQWARGR